MPPPLRPLSQRTPASASFGGERPLVAIVPRIQSAALQTCFRNNLPRSELILARAPVFGTAARLIGALLPDEPLDSRHPLIDAVSARRRPRLLYVSPFVPLDQGRGTAMRAAVHIQALCKLFDVTLALINPDASELAKATPALRAICRDIVTYRDTPLFARVHRALPEWRSRKLLEAAWPVPAAMARADNALRRLARDITAGQFEVVHCFRLHTAMLASFVPPDVRRAARWTLDTDDYESHARFRNAARLRAAGNWAFGILLHLEGLKYRTCESRLIPQFDEAYVCSEGDREHLMRCFPKVGWRVLPNVVSPPPAAPHQDQAAFTFLFVGSLDYPPNREGVLYFCAEVLPHLRRMTSRPFKILVVGRNPDSDIRRLAKLDGVEIVANPPDIAPFYRMADASIAPILAGGGTRIKILEAFSYGLPVVSTTLGAEGLHVAPGVHAEIADSAEAFAEACFRLMENAAVRTRLAEAGQALYSARFSPAVIARAFAQSHAELLQEAAA
jgi:polysaccharide biosynthesis protein PslH